MTIITNSFNLQRILPSNERRCHVRRMIPAGAVVGLKAKGILWRQTALRSTRPLCSAGRSFTLPAPIEAIISKLSEGATEADLLDAYPCLATVDIQSALACAADGLSMKPYRSTTRYECEP